MAGLPFKPLQLYFAYGSNLLEEEFRRTAPGAAVYTRAFLPKYRLAFTKHSITWQADAATIIPDDLGVVWGLVYRIGNQDLESLRKREGGYRECEITVHPDSAAPIKTLTFIAEEMCPKRCGPSVKYLEIIIQGAAEKKLPEAYCAYLRDLLMGINKPSVPTEPPA